MSTDTHHSRPEAAEPTGMGALFSGESRAIAIIIAVGIALHSASIYTRRQTTAAARRAGAPAIAEAR